mgnify:CR=1 FL=1
MGIFDLFKRSKDTVGKQTEVKEKGQRSGESGRYTGKLPPKWDNLVFKHVAEADKTSTQMSSKDILSTIKGREKEFSDDGIPFFKTAKGQQWIENMWDVALVLGINSPSLAKKVGKILSENASTEIEGTLDRY